jgi:hypothetical protein
MKSKSLWTVVRVCMILIVVALIALAAVSCKPAERIVNHTEYVNKIKYDSIYVNQHDSIYVEKNGDTLRVSVYKTIYKNQIRIQKDTVNKTDTLTVLLQGEPKIQTVEIHGFFWWVGLILFIALAAFAGFKLVTWSPVQSIIKKL